LLLNVGFDRNFRFRQMFANQSGSEARPCSVVAVID
jgi:hypothetical protein